MKSLKISGLLLLTLCSGSCKTDIVKVPSKKDFTTWSSYLGDAGRTHFSTLSRINKENVQNLKVAWAYESEDWGQMQMNPIVVDSILYGVTAALRVVALHVETGEELWQFGDSVKVWHSTSRGVSYWSKNEDHRILCTRGAYLFALDAQTGEPIPSFGSGGKVDLRSECLRVRRINSSFPIPLAPSLRI
ncbi:hypothetical protein NYZ99_19835 [Maribacter litopenaei]|uniref:Pyrrolo-quinoline quinone repeat domain-containing protein n=1 Tax=Maribacter litopenaei TaxID=2976127 RepID=A0ABY5Y9B6_9FLAO|nr:hypothetical protein [Maribacter litopenaei]UWX54947.1 hypothetical protein NYZ99_19835 [Maribacter litopenaei]